MLLRATGRKKLCKKELTLLSQYHTSLPCNLAEQLKWSRFVNVHGLPGNNISSDLHMEHLNKLVKVSIEGLGANKSKKTIQRVAMAMGVLSKTTGSFDDEVGVVLPNGKHSEQSQLKDLDKIVQQLLECDPFNKMVKRNLYSFPYMKSNLIKTLNEEDQLKYWMMEQFSTLYQPNMPPPNTEDSCDDSNKSDVEY